MSGRLHFFHGQTRSPKDTSLPTCRSEPAGGFVLSGVGMTLADGVSVSSERAVPRCAQGEGLCRVPADPSALANGPPQPLAVRL